MAAPLPRLALLLTALQPLPALAGEAFTPPNMGLTSPISFFLSALLDNSTTALIMSGVILAVGSGIGRRHEKRILAGTDAGEPYTVFAIIARAEGGTLLFFYGVLVCAGGLGSTWANVSMGVLSAIVDNIPIMYAVLQMAPPMDHGQWLPISLTCGVGGSLLSVGSVAGVALMGVSRGQQAFFGHLKWTWAIALGYIASILVHLRVNAEHFGGALSG